MDRAKLRFLRPVSSVSARPITPPRPVSAVALNTQSPLIRKQPSPSEDVTGWEADYKPAQPARRLCGNCVFWRMSDAQCILHDVSVIAPSNGICRSHVYGTPGPGGVGDAMSKRDLEVLSVETSGLCSPAMPVGCDNCDNYNIAGSTRGVCERLLDGRTRLNLVVQPFGFCRFSTQLQGRPGQS